LLGFLLVFATNFEKSEINSNDQTNDIKITKINSWNEFNNYSYPDNITLNNFKDDIKRHVTTAEIATGYEGDALNPNFIFPENL